MPETIYEDLVSLVAAMAEFAQEHPEYTFLPADDPGRSLIAWIAFWTRPDGTEDAMRWGIPVRHLRGCPTTLLRELLRTTAGRRHLVEGIRSDSIQRLINTQVLVRAVMKRYCPEFVLVLQEGPYETAPKRFIGRDADGHYATHRGPFLRFGSEQEARKYLGGSSMRDIFEQIQGVARVVIEKL